MLKEIIIFTCGAAAGVGAGYFLAKKKFDEEVAEKVEAERNQLRSFFKNKKEKEEETKKVKLEERKTYESLVRPYTSNFVSNKPSIEEILARSSSTPVSPSKEEKEAEKKVEEFVDSPKEERDTPYSISPEDFANTCDYYDKETLIYYEGDGIITDDSGDIVVDPMSIIGYDFHEKFGEFEEGVAYIRNDKIAADYEITREKGSYYADNI